MEIIHNYEVGEFKNLKLTARLSLLFCRNTQTYKRGSNCVNGLDSSLFAESNTGEICEKQEMSVRSINEE